MVNETFSAALKRSGKVGVVVQLLYCDPFISGRENNQVVI